MLEKIKKFLEDEPQVSSEYPRKQKLATVVEDDPIDLFPSEEEHDQAS